MKSVFLFLILNFAFVFNINAQQTRHPAPLSDFTRGVGTVHPDSIFSVNLRFRMQNRAMYNSISTTDLGVSEIEARVRRLRLRLEGFMLDPRLSYLIQLSFSRGDMDWSVRHNSPINESPNVVRDAVIFYRPNQYFQMIFGQTKLPGNRQRVVSSGDLQFVDRSIVNALFNIDRDFGFQLWHFNNIGNFRYNIRTAISTGDGRNVTLTNSGLAYTGRIELLPLGAFTNMGDYFEGDLEREETVKLSIAGGLSHNAMARRTGGQIGRDLFDQRDMTTYIFDGLLKYRGYAIYLEYITRNADNPITFSPVNPADFRYIITGSGLLIQTSYLFRNDYEVAARYANIRPGEELVFYEGAEDVYTLGATRYLRRHRVKLQANISYNNMQGALQQAQDLRRFWNAAFQIELGI
jgi:phosphate-selective porin OprO and OprP